MTHIFNNPKLDRRQLLSGVALGALAAFGATGLGSVAKAAVADANIAPAYWTKARTERNLCSQIHYGKSLDLSAIIDNPNLDEVEKNLALKTAHCPSCGVQIRPGREANGYAIGV